MYLVLAKKNLKMLLCKDNSTVSFSFTSHKNDENLKTAFLNTIACNGWEHVLYKDAAKGTPIEFSWDIDLNDEPVRYKLSFIVDKTVENCNISLEELNSSENPKNYPKEFNYFRCHDYHSGKGNFSTAMKKGKRNRRLAFDISPKETIIKQFKDILLSNKIIYGSEMIRVDIAKILYGLEKYFEDFSVYTTVKFNTQKMRELVDIKSLDTQLSLDGSNFVNIFSHYKAEDLLWKQNFEKKMKELIPDLQSVDSVVAYDKLVFKLIYNDAQFDLSDVSDGTLKGLLLNILINPIKDEEHSLFAIDEPETNLHPAWQKVIGNWILESSAFKQYFISTHSPDFLDVFTERFKYGDVAVFTFDIIKGKQTIKKIMYEDIKGEIGDWELGDLYRTSDPALGGWPW